MAEARRCAEAVRRCCSLILVVLTLTMNARGPCCGGAQERKKSMGQGGVQLDWGECVLTCDSIKVTRYRGIVTRMMRGCGIRYWVVFESSSAC